MNESSIGQIRLLFISALTLLLTACPANKPSNDGKASPSSAIDDGSKQQGGYDWGGGGSIKSSPALVQRTIELAQAMAGEESIHKSIFRQYLTWNLTNLATNQQFKTSVLFPNSGSGLLDDVQFLTDSPALKALALKKIKLLDSGDCPRPKTERTADASVSKHNLDGEVCFSVGNLAKIAPSDLTRQIMGLMLHEAAHLASGDEELASKFQDSFNVYFGIRFGEMLGEASVVNTGFTAGKVSKSDLATYLFIHAHRFLKKPEVLKVRNEFFDERIALQNLIRDSETSGKLPDDLVKMLKDQHKASDETVKIDS